MWLAHRLRIGYLFESVPCHVGTDGAPKSLYSRSDLTSSNVVEPATSADIEGISRNLKNRKITQLHIVTAVLMRLNSNDGKFENSIAGGRSKIVPRTQDVYAEWVWDNEYDDRR